MVVPVAFVGVGSNVAPRTNVARAVRNLADDVRIVAVSTFYQSAPATRPEQEDFFNGVLACDTDLAPARFKLALLRRIESKLGRVRAADKHAPRTIDLDLLAYGSNHGPDTILVIDGDVGRFAHVTIPFAELAPDVVLEDGDTVATRARTFDAHTLTPLPAFTEELRGLARAAR